MIIPHMGKNPQACFATFLNLNVGFYKDLDQHVAFRHPLPLVLSTLNNFRFLYKRYTARVMRAVYL